MKYRHRGYQDDDHDDKRPEREDRPRRDPDLPGGRLAEKQRVLRHLRCHHCGQSLPLEMDARGEPLPVKRTATCSDCDAAVHVCRNCCHFDPQAAFECRRKVKQGYKKNAANDCDEFEPKVTAEMTRDQSRSGGSVDTPMGSVPTGPRSSGRKAFEDLFK